MPAWKTSTLLIVILALAVFLRLYHLHHYCYFFDEAWNDELSTGRGSVHVRLHNDELYEQIPKPTSLAGAAPWYRIWTHMDHVTHPPLYIIALRWWRDVFGESPGVSRAFSGIAGALAVLLLFDIARLLHGTTAALWGSAIVALAGAQIELSQEVRPYAFLLVISLAALCALVRIERLGRSPRRLIAFGAAVLGMVLTHYFAVFAAVAIGAYVLLRLRHRDRRDALLAMILAAIIFAIVWGPFFWQQRGNLAAATEMWMREDSAGHVLRALKRLAEVPMRLLIEPPQHAFPLGYIASSLLVLPFVMLKRRPKMLLWCLWLGGTIFFIALLDLTRSTQHLAYIRYSLLGAPAIYLPLAAMFRPGKSRWLAHVVPACIVVSCLGALPEAYEVPKPEYRQLASYLDNNIRPGDAVVFYSSGDDAWFCSAIWLNTCYYSSAYPWPFVMMTHPPDDAMVNRLRQFRSIWLVSASSDMNGQKLIPRARVDGGQFFPFVCTCERVTADPNIPLPRPVPPKALSELR